MTEEPFNQDEGIVATRVPSSKASRARRAQYFCWAFAVASSVAGSFWLALEIGRRAPRPSVLPERAPSLKTEADRARVLQSLESEYRMAREEVRGYLQIIAGTGGLFVAILFGLSALRRDDGSNQYPVSVLVAFPLGTVSCAAYGCHLYAYTFQVASNSARLERLLNIVQGDGIFLLEHVYVAPRGWEFVPYLLMWSLVLSLAVSVTGYAIRELGSRSPGLQRLCLGLCWTVVVAGVFLLTYTKVSRETWTAYQVADWMAEVERVRADQP